jgi:hypothetical protein
LEYVVVVVNRLIVDRLRSVVVFEDGIVIELRRRRGRGLRCMLTEDVVNVIVVDRFG